VPPNPAERNGALDTGTEFLATAASRQKRLIDALNEDAAILCRIDAVRDLNDLAGGSIGIGKRGDTRRTSCRCSIFLSNFLTLGGSPRHAGCVDG